VTSAPADFKRAAGGIVEDWLRLEPESATQLGDHRYDGLLDDRSEAGISEKVTAYQRHRGAMEAIDSSELDSDDRADREILLGALAERVFALEELREVEWDPLVYNPGDALYPLTARETIPVSERLVGIASRLEQIPELLELASRQLVNPPKIHVETALLQNSGTVSLVTDEVSRLLEQEPTLTSKVEPAQSAALEALLRYGAFLEDLEKNDGGDFRLGPDRFAKKLQLTLDSALSAQEILERADAHLEVLETQILEVSRLYLAESGLSAPAEDRETIGLALEHVARHRPDDDTVLRTASDALVQATRAVETSAIVTVPDAEMVVEMMPEFRRGVAVAYCDAPGPLEIGGRTFLAVAPTPESWSGQRVESFYREYNTAMILDLIVHEAMPGHAVQLAHGRRFSGSTPVRQVFMSGSFIEGWAVHAERLMADAGLGGTAVRLQQLKMQLRMTINAILDARVHAGGMTETQALELMTVRGFQEEGEAAGKWRRACLTSAQLSTYFVGYVELDDAFGRMGRKLGGGFDPVLAHGSPPPRLVEQLTATD
jgi:uncharacterized protein (DUF885 family)